MAHDGAARRRDTSLLQHPRRRRLPGSRSKSRRRNQRDTSVACVPALGLCVHLLHRADVPAQRRCHVRSQHDCHDPARRVDPTTYGHLVLRGEQHRPRARLLRHLRRGVADVVHRNDPVPVSSAVDASVRPQWGRRPAAGRASLRHRVRRRFQRSDHIVGDASKPRHGERHRLGGDADADRRRAREHHGRGSVSRDGHREPPPVTVRVRAAGAGLGGLRLLRR